MSVKIVWETLRDSDSPAQVRVLLRGENKVVGSVNAGQCETSMFETDNLLE